MMTAVEALVFIYYTFTIRRFLRITYFSSQTLSKDDDNASEDMSWSFKETQKESS